jgi:hypothetical protein
VRPFSIERLHAMFEIAPAPTVWRHDVDVSPTAAVSMARFEQERGIRSTFYVMTTSPFYTATDAVVLAAQVSALGHRVGLHADLRATPLDNVRRLGDLSVSFHCPDESVMWKKLAGVRSAYAPIWKGRYFSDSRGVFAQGDPEDHFGGEPLQINLHPEWWFDPFFADAIDDETYERFFHEPKQAVA